MNRPESPCIGVCTTTYDDFCKGCGRHFVEVAEWHAMPKDSREDVWQRIEAQATAWRFNRYKDRVKAA